METVIYGGFFLCTTAAVYFTLKALDWGRQRRQVLSRLARYAAEPTGGRGAGYHPGSLSDPRD